VKIAEDYAMLQHLADGRVDLMMGRGNTGPVYPWFGKDIRAGIPLAIENYACCTGCGARTSSTGRASSARRCRASPRRRARSTTCRRSSGTARSAAPRSPSRPPTTATASSPTTSSGREHTQRMIALYRQRFEHYGHGTADQAIVGLGGQVFMRKNSQDAVNDEFRPYFDNAPVYGHGPSLEDFTARRR
jgi:alkanesulfonate monooxygenase SsuD/methylene tetrahydromethanopterin reductase-like flavin-dependent oxidoreductase (luciferase family)